ncbi:DMT family transporter [Actimicrobium sp. CCC2.4]|uniref:DMT family transporter n=1 Tax=Actimicrobium sp. CCC2.4 TaxID=3048606 RepID=UPI002AC9C61A|nr:DMT family transporter [Actimicrobium sp. CCC2.4]MEB0137359.1 DMT family transporter [Actimicrobium sp. CCC2.4]WPX33380.1 DMT family transporter [Actimicrobium sp. CCC2.4]
MSTLRLTCFTLFAVLCFAGNSILCRLAFQRTGIDAASFTAIRVVSGALMLVLLVWLRRVPPAGGTTAMRLGGNWWSALALMIYAAGFSFAYVSLSTGTGALLLFGAVQATMIAAGLRAGERFGRGQIAGLVIALAGLVLFLLPGLSAPPLGGALLMMAAGIAWGVYSLRGRGVADPAGETAGNFVRAAPMAIVLAIALLAQQRLDGMGIVYAVLSGALASGIGYTVWYAALRGLTALRAASVQLSAPVLAAIAGVLFLQEPLSVRLVLASVAMLGGIALVLVNKRVPA